MGEMYTRENMEEFRCISDTTEIYDEINLEHHCPICDEIFYFYGYEYGTYLMACPCCGYKRYGQLEEY